MVVCVVVLASAQGGGRRGQAGSGKVSSALAESEEGGPLSTQEDAKSTNGLKCSLHGDVRSSRVVCRRSPLPERAHAALGLLIPKFRLVDVSLAGQFRVLTSWTAPTAVPDSIPHALPVETRPMFRLVARQWQTLSGSRTATGTLRLPTPPPRASARLFRTWPAASDRPLAAIQALNSAILIPGSVKDTVSSSHSAPFPNTLLT
jgi:hypothetical protein